MEPTRGKVRYNLTFRRTQVSQKVGIPVILKTELSDVCKNEVLKYCDSENLAVKVSGTYAGKQVKFIVCY